MRDARGKQGSRRDAGETARLELTDELVGGDVAADRLREVVVRVAIARDQPADRARQAVREMPAAEEFEHHEPPGGTQDAAHLAEPIAGKIAETERANRA